jgi:hypothetical protein
MRDNTGEKASKERKQRDGLVTMSKLTQSKIMVEEQEDRSRRQDKRRTARGWKQNRR